MKGQMCFAWLSVVTVLVAFGGLLQASELSYVTVGDAGNGNVGYRFAIAEFEVTNDDYLEFMNSCNPTNNDNLGLYNTSMASDPNGGISYVGLGYGQRFAVKAGMGSKPVNFVCWYDAIRFANWLTNGKPVGTNITYTDTGTYTITGGGFNSGTVALPSAAQRAAWMAAGEYHVLLPTSNEWVKAGHYKGGASGAFWTYATATDTKPTAEDPPGGTNSVCCTATSVNDGYDYDPGGPKDVGAYTNSASPYRTFDQAGSVWEWTEDFSSPNAYIMGAGWSSAMSQLQLGNALHAMFFAATTEQDWLGFRVVRILAVRTGTLFSIR